tara:strand:- start:928 stop:1116 length:189 start_codon:yes stop_codon:yes gene_type:complete
MRNFSDDFDDDDDNDDGLTDYEKQIKNNIAQAKADQGRFDGDDSVEDMPDSAVSNSDGTSRD